MGKSLGDVMTMSCYVVDNYCKQLITKMEFNNNMVQL